MEESGKFSKKGNLDLSEETREEIASESSAEKPGYLLLENVSSKQTSDKIRTFFERGNVTAEIVAQLCDDKKKSKTTGLVCLAVDDIDLAAEVVRTMTCDTYVRIVSLLC